MKDGLEVAEGVKTASSATNGDKCDAMRPLDEQRTASNGLDIDTLPSTGPTAKNGNPKNGAADKTFTCSICKRCFGYKHVLQNHERTHTGEKPFECPECHKRFTRDHHLKTHMRLHTGEKPYQCPHCDRHFVQVANLRRHLRVHTGERPYACTVDLCEARFSDSNQLKAHMLIHRGEKPFQCTECLGRFRRRHHLIHHRCPKDKSNMGKPRRGRRPKAYDHHQIPSSDHEEEEEEDLDQDEELLQISDNEENMVDNSNSSPEPETIASPPVIVHPISTVVHSTNGINGTNGISSANGINGNGINGTNGIGTNGVNGTHGTTGSNGDHVVVSNGSRRKPSRTIRILTPQQRELFLRDKVTMQTQAIDMSLSQPVTVIVPNRFLDDGVLDLSSSRSDSEADIIDPVCSTPTTVCPCSLHTHFARRRPLSQRIANQRNGTKMLEPVRLAHSSGSDDSNESHMTTDGHHLQNGHISEEDDSIGAIPLTANSH